MGRAPQIKSFEKWLGETLEARRLHAVVARVGKRMQHREACAAVGSWQAIMEEKRELAVKLRRAAGRRLRAIYRSDL